MQSNSVCQLPIIGPGYRSSQPLSVLLATDLLHVSFGPLLFLFPARVHLMATLGMSFGAILLMCPIHRHPLLLISTDSGVVFVMQ